MLGVFAYSCKDVADDDDDGDTRAFIASEISGTNRIHFVSFKVRTNKASAGEYKIGAVNPDPPNAPPTASELRAATAALTLDLSTKDIKVFLAFHIGGTYFDPGATQNIGTAKATALAENTNYDVYIVPVNGGGITKLLTLSTDQKPTATTNIQYGIPEGTYTIKEGNPILLFGYNFWSTTAGINGIAWQEEPGGSIHASCPNFAFCFPTIGFGVYADGTGGYLVAISSYTSASVPKGIYLSDNGGNATKGFDILTQK